MEHIPFSAVTTPLESTLYGLAGIVCGFRHCVHKLCYSILIQANIKSMLKYEQSSTIHCVYRVMPFHTIPYSRAFQDLPVMGHILFGLITCTCFPKRLVVEVTTMQKETVQSPLSTCQFYSLRLVVQRFIAPGVDVMPLDNLSAVQHSNIQNSYYTSEQTLNIKECSTCQRDVRIITVGTINDGSITSRL